MSDNKKPVEEAEETHIEETTKDSDVSSDETKDMKDTEETAENESSDSKESSQTEAASDKDKKESPEEKKPEKPQDEEPGKWYVVHTQSGFEAKAKESLEQRIQTLGFQDRIFEVIVPMRDIVTINKGQKRQKKEKVFPGYILVRMILSNDSWIVVRTTQGITGFVGAGTKPTPISQKEVQAIMKFVKQEQPKFKAKFSVGEAVKVTDGPFSDFVGTINHIDEDKGRVTVLVSIFGRETPVELDFLQVSKL